MVVTVRSLRLYHRLMILSALPFIPVVSFIFYLIIYDPATITEHLYVTLFSACMLIAYAYFSWTFISRLSRGISVVENSALDLVNGRQVVKSTVSSVTEIVNTLDHLHNSREDTQRHTVFAEQIVQGNLEATYESRNGRDALGHVLVRIKESMINIREEDMQRNWAAEGLAKFVVILQSTKHLKDLSNDIIINLVRIIQANQGAIFLVEQDASGNDVLDMQACYAYHRTKFITQRIAPGEGVIGQAYLEKETVYLKDIPDQFVRITSGLGEANPRNILIVPLKANDVVVGMIEVASFREFHKHEIVFVEKISETIAHTVSSFQTADHTRKLLDEAQAHAEQMRAQEEELRQNQEELQATQEEISRKYNVLFQQLGELNYQSKFDQLRSITFAKKRNVEYYFDIIRNQILTFSEDRMIVEAVKAFRAAFYTVNDTMDATMRDNLRKYYDTEFISRLNDNVNGKATAEQYMPANNRAEALQYWYVSSNPYPTGQKSLLDNAGDGSEYSKVHHLYHPILRSFLEKFGYYDIFLIDARTGDMVYSVFKEVDFATSLLNGKYSTTNFGTVVKLAMQSTDKNFVRLIDFEPYDPSYHAPASFIACPVFEGDEKIGILVFQMPINKINQILTGDNHWVEDGLGESGETIMVGEDFKLRSIVREFIEDPQAHLASLRRQQYDEDTLRQINKMNTNILLEKITSDAVLKALNGRSGTLMDRDARETEMLNAYAPLRIPDVRWVILSRMKEAEASMRINDLQMGKL